MTAEQNRKTVRRYYDEVLNEGRLDLLDEIAVADYRENAPLPGQAPGRAGLVQRVSMLAAALRQRFTVEQLVADEDLVAVRWTAQGTQVGDFMGIPATNRPFTASGIDIHRLEEGRLAEHWHEVDLFGLLQQLGVIQQPSGAPA